MWRESAMAIWSGPIADVSPYVTAAFGLLGSLIGGAIAGTVSLRVARQTRDAAERSWIRDNRRNIYDRFLTSAQKLLIACEASNNLRETPGAQRDEPRHAVENAHNDFFEAYGVVQTVADRPVVDAARVYAYRLLELGATQRPGFRPGLKDANFGRVAQLVRFARHDTIDAMRAELGLAGSAQPPHDFNPFRGTDLEDDYTARPAER
jgi:hypothetical protein